MQFDARRNYRTDAMEYYVDGAAVDAATFALCVQLEQLNSINSLVATVRDVVHELRDLSSLTTDATLRQYLDDALNRAADTLATFKVTP